MTIRSLVRKIHSGRHLNAVVGYCQGDVWVIKRVHEGDWTAINDTEPNVLRNHDLAWLVQHMAKHHGVRVWATL